MVSIVIPVYNVEKYLEECVESALAQTYQDLQIILVNDGSTDSSGRICDMYASKDSRISVVHKKNGGLSDARNVGTSVSTGEFILYLDSDDYLEHNAVQGLLNTQKSFHADVVVGNYFYTYGDRDEIAEKATDEGRVFDKKEAIRSLMSGQIQTFAWGKLIRTEIAKQHLFPVGILFEDHFWTHLVFQDSDTVVCIPQPIVHYRQREDSISYTFTEKRLDIIKGWETRIAFLQKEYPEYSHMFLSRCAQDAVSLAWLILVHMKNKDLGFRHLQSFIIRYHLDEYCVGDTNKLIRSLKKGHLTYVLLALRFKIKDRLQCRK